MPARPPARPTSRSGAERSFLIAIAVVVALVAAVGLASRRRLAGCDGKPGFAPPPEAALAFDAATPIVARDVVAAAPDASAVACSPRARQSCWGGDVWWLDGCGKREEIVELCGQRLCDDGRCVPPDGRDCSAPPAVGPGGRCDGTRLTYCIGGVAHTVDCTAVGRVCARRPDGDFACVEGKPCTTSALGRCNEDGELEVCVDGQQRDVTCSLVGAVCQVEPGSGRARCVRKRHLRSRDIDPRCGACGCPEAGPEGAEVCDGWDNDRDGRVDNGTPCAPIPLLAFVVNDASGAPAESRERIERDVAALSAALAHPEHPTGLSVEFAGMIPVDRPEWFDADDDDAQHIFFALHQYAERTGFYVPVIYVRRLTLDLAEVAGASPLPMGVCGDRRLGFPGADGSRGAVILARQRNKTTLAHEFGHFLGLCHTHQPGPRLLVEEAIVDDTGATTECGGCRREGDGVCDTPFDPWPSLPSCTAITNPPECVAICDGDTPELRNLMSYWVPCRAWFTEEQAVHLRRNLARRVRWSACAGEACPCDPAADGDVAVCGAPWSMMRCTPLINPPPGFTPGRCRPESYRPAGFLCSYDIQCAWPLVCAPLRKPDTNGFCEPRK